MKHLLAAIATLGLMTMLAPTKASAQTLNMDMSWAMRSQMQNQAYGNAYAQALAQSYYNYMQMLRQRGYTGPSLPTGFNAGTLMQSGQAANAAAAAYIKGLGASSNAKSNATADWDLRAVRGCYRYGNVYYCY